MVKKILFVSIFKEGEGGGEGRVAYEFARWLARYFRVVMLCPGDETGLFLEESGFWQYHIKSITQGNLSMPLLSPANNLALFRFLDVFQPDIIHLHDPALLNVVAQMWAKDNQVPVFYTAHVLPSRILDFGASEISNLLSTPLNEILAERYLLSFYQNCDCVVALNERAEAEIRNFGYSGLVVNIPNGRNLNLYHACRFADPSAQVKKLAFTGFLSKRKNQFFLLEMLQYLPPSYLLTLIGEPLVAEYQQELEQFAAGRQLNVRFTGRLEQEEIAAELEQTHVFVSASRMEVQSLVVIEALASGTPIVGLSNETVDELVGDGDGIRLPSETSPQEFAAAVQRICELPTSDYQKLCAGARQRVMNLDWSNVMESTITTYDEVLAQHQNTPKNMTGEELLDKYLTILPPGRLKDDIAEILTSIAIPRPPSTAYARLVSLTGLNIAASMVAYPLLKVPTVRINRLAKPHLKFKRR